MAKILLNEGTKIEVKETKEEVKKKIKEEVRKEKKDENRDHFITLIAIDKEYTNPKIGTFGIMIPAVPTGKITEVEIDVYYKRILFIYN